jgi:hypothetical protein
MLNYCKVSQCKFPFSHTTKGHNCNKCKLYGHGILECNNINLINNLEKYYSEKIYDPCTFNGCKNTDYHNNQSHHCNYCYGKLHSRNTCLLFNNKLLLNNKNPLDDNYNIICPLCKCNNIINKKQSKLYGNNEQCIICMGNNIDVFFPDCGHACICFKCCIKLSDELMMYNEDKIKNKFYNYPCYTIINNKYILRRLNINHDIEYLLLDNNNNDKINNFINGYALIL